METRLKNYVKVNLYFQIVQTLYLWNEDDVIHYHRDLANHFLACKQDTFHIADSILHHLVAAKMNKELQNYFQKDKRSLRNGHMRRHLAIEVRGRF